MQLADSQQAAQTTPQQLRSADSFTYSIRLERPWGWLDRAIAWTKTEITGEWRWQIVTMSSDQRPGEYIFYFDSNRDYFAFCIKFL
jgi:hypothetical protein